MGILFAETGSNRRQSSSVVLVIPALVVFLHVLYVNVKLPEFTFQYKANINFEDTPAHLFWKPPQLPQFQMNPLRVRARVMTMYSSINQTVSLYYLNEQLLSMRWGHTWGRARGREGTPGWDLERRGRHNYGNSGMIYCLEAMEVFSGHRGKERELLLQQLVFVSALTNRAAGL